LNRPFECNWNGDVLMNAITKTDAIKTLTAHYIDGAFVESHGREVRDIIRPTDGRVIGQVTLGDEEDTRRAIAAAKRAFATYGKSKPEERAEILRRLHRAASARIDDLTAAMVDEYGGVVQFARPIVESAVNAFAAAEKALPEIQWTRSWDKAIVTMEPVGVSGLITAWNANALFMCLKFASAVGAGCTAVIKPSEMSSLQARVLVEALHEAKLPNGLLNIVTGLGTTVGAELVRNPDVAKISFTGSVAVGQSIMRDGAATMKRVTLELGGKSPTIVLDDADLDQAIPTALGMAFMNSGQACAAGTRLLVPSNQLDAAKRAIVNAMRAITVGDPADPKIAVGPMVSQKQYERVQSYVRKGIEEGAEVLVGGEGHPQGLEAGYFVKPTVFVNVKNDMTIAREEIFGPVLSVIAYDTEDDAVAIANDSRYGLHAAVLGTDLARARRVASRLRTGRVVINGMTDDPQAPWGGFKYSGVGREYGRYGIEAYLETRAILEG
jgi:aldehyde dehydrogenase (NAD+)